VEKQPAEADIRPVLLAIHHFAPMLYEVADPESIATAAF